MFFACLFFFFSFVCRTLHCGPNSQNICLGNSTFREVESVTARSSYVSGSGAQIVCVKGMTDCTRIWGKRMGNVVGMGRRASWVTSVNSRCLYATEVAGSVNKCNLVWRRQQERRPGIILLPWSGCAAKHILLLIRNGECKITATPSQDLYTLFLNLLWFRKSPLKNAKHEILGNDEGSKFIGWTLSVLVEEKFQCCIFCYPNKLLTLSQPAPFYPSPRRERPKALYWLFNPRKCSLDSIFIKISNKIKK